MSRSATGKYFASVCCKAEVEELPKVEKEVGVCLGVNNLLVDSDGVVYENPGHYSKAEKRLAREQRRLSRRKKGSANYEKQRIKVAKLHEHISNQRKDTRHKISRKLVDENQLIAVEKQNIKAMVEGNSQAKTILDAGWAELTGMMKYKAAWAGRTVVDVDMSAVSTDAPHGVTYAMAVLDEGKRINAEGGSENAKKKGGRKKKADTDSEAKTSDPA